MKRLKYEIIALIATLQIAFGCRQEFCNVGEKFHDQGDVTKYADGNHTELYSVVTAGSDADHVALCGVNDRPRAVAQDIPSAGDPLKVLLLGKGPTKIAVGSAGIAANTLLVPADAGRVAALSDAPGTYWVLGESATACAGAGEQLEIVDCFPHQVTVAG